MMTSHLSLQGRIERRRFIMSGMSRPGADRPSRLARAAALSGTSGNVCPADRATLLLEAIIEPGDRVTIEGDNQKQADFLASALAKVDPAQVHDLHMVQSVLALPDHLAVPGFRRWLMQRLAEGNDPDTALFPELERDGWWHDLAQSEKLRPALMRLCALYLTRQPSPGSRVDPVARFHLGNGARLERINWFGNAARRAIQESFGIMVNYLYDHNCIEDNHEAFVRDGTIVRSPDVDALLEALAPMRAA